MKWGLISPKGLDSIDNSDARLNIWHGAVRSSKTVCSIIRWLDFVQNGPPGELLMCGKTERTLKRNILDPIVQMVGEKRAKFSVGTGEGHIFGRRIYLAGAPNALSEDKIRGGTLVGAYADEITILDQDFFRMLLSRLSEPGAQLFGTTNPDGPFHWFKAILDNPALDLKQWAFTLDDNLNLDPKYVASLKAEYMAMGQLWYDRMILGLWVLAQGLIYDKFDLAKHGFEDKDRLAYDRIDYAFDYGTQNAFVGLEIGVKGDCSDVLREYYYSGRDEQSQKTDGEYADDVEEWQKGANPAKHIIDPSAASMIAEMKKRKWKGVTEADNAVIPGIKTVSGRLASGKLRIHRKNCPNLIKEFGLYSWDKKAVERGEDKPLKQNDHAVDALRYHEHTVFGKEKKIVKVYEEGIY